MVKEKSELEKKYDNMASAISEWANQLAYDFMHLPEKWEQERIAYKQEQMEKRKKKPTADPAPTEDDFGFTDESKWGTCTPAFLLENGFAESEERAVSIAKDLLEHQEKKTGEYFRELFVKAQFRLPSDRRKKGTSDFNFEDLAMIAKDIPVKVEVMKADKEPEPVADEPVDEPNVANAAPVQQVNPGYNPMDQFIRGIPLDQQPQQPAMVATPMQPQQNVVSVNGILYALSLDQFGNQVMVPFMGGQPIGYGGNSNPFPSSQQTNPPQPVGIMMKTKEERTIVDTGMKVEGELPGVDPSLVKGEPVKVKITPMVEKEDTLVENPLLSIVKGGHPEISDEAGNTLLWDVLSTIKDSGYTCDFRELRDEAMVPVGVYEFHLFNGDQEISDLKFIVDLGKIFDKRAKFCTGVSANLEFKEWFELQKNVGKNLVYTDEILTKFFRNGKKWLFNQRSMYNKQWRDINKSFVDLSSLPEQPSKEARQTLNGIISDLYNCRELQAVINDVIPEPRFKVIEYTDSVLLLSNDSVKTNILGTYNNDPIIMIAYGADGKNIATVKTATSETQVTVPHNSAR